MKIAVVTLYTIILGPAALAAPPDPIKVGFTTKLEACIANHAAEVERSESSLPSAVEFLLKDLCANEIEAYNRYNQSVLTVGMARLPEDQQVLVKEGLSQAQADSMAKGRAALARATINPNTGAIEGISDMDLPYEVGFIDPSSVPAKFRAVAAHAVLAAREAREGRKSDTR